MTGKPAEPRYDAARAASYWSGARLGAGDELAAVLSLGEPPAVKEAYDRWESGLVLAAVPSRGARSALDVGTGVGRVALRVASRVDRVAAGDLAPGMLDRLKRNAATRGVSNLDAVRFRSDQLPVRDRSVDLVLCLGLLEHLPAALRVATLAESARVLRPGGALLLVLNNAGSELLRGGGDNPLRVGRQQENGYFCEVVDGTSLLDGLRSSFEDRPLGANLFYSLARHAARLLPDGARGNLRLRPFFERAAAWDVALRPLGGLARRAADHHVHLLVRR